MAPENYNELHKEEKKKQTNKKKHLLPIPVWSSLKMKPRQLPSNL